MYQILDLPDLEGVQMFCTTGSQLDVLIVIVIERTEPINIELDLYN